MQRHNLLYSKYIYLQIILQSLSIHFLHYFDEESVFWTELTIFGVESMVLGTVVTLFEKSGCALESYFPLGIIPKYQLF